MAQASVRHRAQLWALLVIALHAFATTKAEDIPSESEELSADNIEQTIEANNEAHALGLVGHVLPDASISQWVQWRQSTLDALHLTLAISYDTLGMGAFGSGNEKGAASGDVAVQARWQIISDSSDTPLALALRLRDRFAYGDLAPSNLRRATGALWGYVSGFSDAGFEIPELYLEQRLFDRCLSFRLGQMNIDDYFDEHELRSAKRFFLNQAFSSSPAVGFSGYGLGSVLRWKSPQNWDFTAGVSSMESPSLSDQARWSYNSKSLFEVIQIGYDFAGWEQNPARLQIMGWHADELPEYSLPQGNGLSCTAEQSFAGGGHTFLRLAHSFGEAAPVAQMFTLGFGQELNELDRVGLALAAGNSSKDSGSWQGVVEIFYRHQNGPTLQITPDIQAIVGDGLQGWRFVAGLRASFNF